MLLVKTDTLENILKSAVTPKSTFLDLFQHLFSEDKSDFVVRL